MWTTTAKNRQWRDWFVAVALSVLVPWAMAQNTAPAAPAAPAAAPAAPADATKPAATSTPAVAASAPAEPTGCLVARFKALGLGQHDVQRRVTEAKAWLRRNVRLCTLTQLNAIRGNSPTWLGTALTQDMASFIEGAIEVKVLGNPQLMAELYNSLGKEGQAGVVSIRTPKPRPPVQRTVVVMNGDDGENREAQAAAPAPAPVPVPVPVPAPSKAPSGADAPAPMPPASVDAGQASGQAAKAATDAAPSSAPPPAPPRKP